jgi:hypothetical protein
MCILMHFMLAPCEKKNCQPLSAAESEPGELQELLMCLWSMIFACVDLGDCYRIQGELMEKNVQLV